MRILYNSIIDPITTLGIVSPAAVSSDFVSTNMFIPDPGIPFRTATLDSDFRFDMDVGPDGFAYDTVVVGATSFTPHRNGVVSGHLLWNAQWTKTNVSPIGRANDVPTGYALGPYEFNATTSNASLARTETKSASEAQAVVHWIIVKDDDTDGVTSHVRLYLEGASSSHNASADFNLTTGAVNGSASSAGDFADEDAGVDSLGSGWFICWLKATTDAHSALTHQVVFLDSSFGTTTTNTESLFIGLAQIDWFQTSRQPAVISRDALDRAAFWRLYTSWDGSTPEEDSGWMNWSRAGDLQHQLNTWNYYTFSQVRAEKYLHLEYSDPEGQGNIDIGRVMCGASLNLSGNLKHQDGVSVGYEESGGEHIMRGGQIIRGINKKRRVLEANLHYMSRQNALFELGKLERIAGRSLPVFAAIDDSSNPVGEELMIYGYIENLDHRRHLATDYWNTRIVLRERIA